MAYFVLRQFERWVDEDKLTCQNVDSIDHRPETWNDGGIYSLNLRNHRSYEAFDMCACGWLAETIKRQTMSSR